MARRSRNGSPESGVMLLAEVARLYYVEDLTQERIAQRIGGSRSNVSRMLREAREKGLVDIKIRTPLEDVPRLQDELKDLLRLEDCLVLAAGGDHTFGLDFPDGRDRMAAFVARYVQESVRDESVLGVGWSRTIYRSLNSGYLRRKRGVDVVQLMGSVGSSIPELNGISIAARLADALGATAHYLHTPMLVADAAVRNGLLRDANIRKTLQLARNSDAMLVGVGEIGPDHGQYLTGYLSDSDLGYISSSGAICDVCGTYVSLDGETVPLEMNERTVAVSREDMMNIPRRIGVSWGAQKTKANLGAVRSGLVNVLITDEAAAEGMLTLLETRTI